MTDHRALRDLAVAIAEDAGTILLDHQAHIRAGGAIQVDSKSSETDPVSTADRDAEASLVNALNAARPDDGLLGEEGADRVSRSGIRWVLDPLDGTVNFLYGHPSWSVSVCAEARLDDAADDLEADGWVAVAGAVVEPSTRKVYAAVRGEGSTCSGRPLRVNDPVALERALVATGFDYDAAHRREQADVARHVLGRVRDLRRVGSAALDLCRVAEGSVDAYYEDSTHRWDWAAGALIAREAGARLSRLDVPGSDKTGVVAAGAALHDPLRAVITGPR